MSVLARIYNLYINFAVEYQRGDKNMMPISNYKELVSAVERGVYRENEWFIFIIVNPDNETQTVRRFRATYDYLHLRTRDIKYFIPGLKRNGEIKSLIALWDFLSFGVKNLRKSPWDYFSKEGMLETVNWFETSCPDYKYREGIELVIIKSMKVGNKTTLDVRNLISVNLETIQSAGGNIVDAIREIGEILGECRNIDEAKQGINNYLTPFSNIVKCFVAGSKDLWGERNAVRAQLQKVSNMAGIYITAYTYEDFGRVFNRGGHQADYNRFIKEEANYAIFIIDGKVGSVTFQEFQVALEAFENGKRKPKIFVYCKDVDNSQGEIRQIIEKTKSLNQYYTKYQDIRELEYRVYEDFTREIIEREIPNGNRL